MLMYINCDVPTEVSPEDFDYLSGLIFKLHPKGYLWCRSGEHKNEMLHSIVARRMGLDVTKVIDHKDTVKLNNQRDNLREATDSQNQANRNLNRNNTSGIKGVYYVNRDNTWRAQIMINHKCIVIGDYLTKEEANLARREAEVFYFGEFANSGAPK